MDKLRIITQLRAKADSTTFPEEAASLRARADRLEAKYGRPPLQGVATGFRALRGQRDLADLIRTQMMNQGAASMSFQFAPGKDGRTNLFVNVNAN